MIEPIAKLAATEKLMILSQFASAASAPCPAAEHILQASRARRRGGKMAQKGDFAGPASFATGSIVYFDGSCGLCHATVRFLIKQDKKKKLLFAPLQGSTAKEGLGDQLERLVSANSLVVQTEEGKILVRSKAIFRALWQIGGAWKILGTFSFLPTFISDLVYRFVASHRHSLGFALKRPTAEEKERFLP